MEKIKYKFLFRAPGEEPVMVMLFPSPPNAPTHLKGVMRNGRDAHQAPCDNP